MALNLPALAVARFKAKRTSMGKAGTFATGFCLCIQSVIVAPMPEENVMNDEHHVQHMFLHVESSDAVCMLNIAGHPYRLRELVFMMIENGCRIMVSSADVYKTSTSIRNLWRDTISWPPSSKRNSYNRRLCPKTKRAAIYGSPFRFELESTIAV